MLQLTLEYTCSTSWACVKQLLVSYFLWLLQLLFTLFFSRLAGLFSRDHSRLYRVHEGSYNKKNLHGCRWVIFFTDREWAIFYPTNSIFNALQRQLQGLQRSQMSINSLVHQYFSEEPRAQSTTLTCSLLLRLCEYMCMSFIPLRSRTLL